MESQVTRLPRCPSGDPSSPSRTLGDREPDSSSSGFGILFSAKRSRPPGQERAPISWPDSRTSFSVSRLRPKSQTLTRPSGPLFKQTVGNLWFPRRMANRPFLLQGTGLPERRTGGSVSFCRCRLLFFTIFLQKDPFMGEGHCRHWLNILLKDGKIRSPPIRFCRET